MRMILCALPAVTLLALGASAAEPAKKSAARPSQVERGKYLVMVGGCNDCHTPKKMGPNGPEEDHSRMLSGHPQQVKATVAPKLEMPWIAATSMDLTAWSGPWGISYSANLTPDTTSGLGVPNLWTEELFIKALRTGKHFGTGRPILPPMPWFNYGKMTDEDLKAIWAYLRSIPPVKNVVPDAVIIAPPAPPGAPAAAAPTTK